MARKSDRPLSVEERAAIVQALQTAMQWCGVGRTPATPAQLHELVNQAVEGYRNQSEAERTSRLENTSRGLGAMWGQILCDQFGWNWVMVQVDNRDECFAVVNAGRSHVIYPFKTLTGVLANKVREQPIPKIFDALTTNKLPKSLPRGYMVVSGGGSTLLF